MPTASGAEPARQLLGRQLARHLQQHQGFAPRLGHDPVPHLLVERRRDHRFQQRARLMGHQALDHEGGKILHVLVLTALAHGENKGDRLGPQAPGGKLERLCRGPV